MSPFWGPCADFQLVSWKSTNSFENINKAKSLQKSKKQTSDEKGPQQGDPCSCLVIHLYQKIYCLVDEPGPGHPAAVPPGGSQHPAPHPPALLRLQGLVGLDHPLSYLLHCYHGRLQHFIGQYVNPIYRREEDGVQGVDVGLFTLASWNNPFIRIGENLVQHPNIQLRDVFWRFPPKHLVGHRNPYLKEKEISGGICLFVCLFILVKLVTA